MGRSALTGLESPALLKARWPPPGQMARLDRKARSGRMALEYPAPLKARTDPMGQHRLEHPERRLAPSLQRFQMARLAR